MYEPNPSLPAPGLPSGEDGCPMPNPPWVVIADDDPDDRAFLQRAFNRAGVRVRLHFLGDGRALVDHLQAMNPGAPDWPRLVVVDLNMPGMDGAAAIAAIRCAPALAQLPIVTLSTSNWLEDRQRCEASGADDFLTKPDRLDAWVALVQAMAGRWLAAPRG